MAPSLPLQCSLEVANALAAGQPVVALESTIIAHGLPHPDNAKTAQFLEQTIRERGAVPATIAVLEGLATVGLNAAELAHIANPEIEILKLSRRDLPFAFSQNRTGATTVATTMLIAAAAGIRVFATGGIGGVHRGAEVSFDISADLPELGQSDVAVVCAGPKAILNIPATLEYLETLGVPVIGYRCDMMPVFWSQSTDLHVDYRLDSAAQIAELCIQKWQAGLNGGVLIANPVPQAEQIDPETIESAIADALALADQKSISGKALTPFLLEQIRHITDGASLYANKALVHNNALLATDIAVEMTG
ncbi:MAG: pseudouridine-5'-phosphate glycosidase [Pseudomonadota bacterium]|nr:pseudouridine-5'-phosphate glycosidase [Pseudomonadota bacterium]